MKVGDITYMIDLAAEEVIAAEKEGEKIAIEIKSFQGNSNTYEFHNAVGQYQNYLVALKLKDPNRKLYLAISKL